MLAKVCDLCGEIIDASTIGNIKLKVRMKILLPSDEIEEKMTKWQKIDAHPQCIKAVIKAAKERSEKDD